MDKYELSKISHRVKFRDMVSAIVRKWISEHGAPKLVKVEVVRLWLFKRHIFEDCCDDIKQADIEFSVTATFEMERYIAEELKKDCPACKNTGIHERVDLNASIRCEYCVRGVTGES